MKLDAPPRPTEKHSAFSVTIPRPPQPARRPANQANYGPATHHRPANLQMGRRPPRDQIVAYDGNRNNREVTATQNLPSVAGFSDLVVPTNALTPS